MSMLKKLWKDEAGLETVEYAVIAALIVVGAIVALRSIGGKVQTTFETLDTNLTPAE
ncbi:MAG: Flp family type IVb pilin [Planctomycetaceae bacterium]|nr:Flp family type IVb pilin [Planctomycetaceae bacterium]